jgi:hypothetical protein
MHASFPLCCSGVMTLTGILLNPLEHNRQDNLNAKTFFVDFLLLFVM